MKVKEQQRKNVAGVVRRRTCNGSEKKGCIDPSRWSSSFVISLLLCGFRVVRM